MIGVGDAIGNAIETILILSLFTLVFIPTISLIGFKKTDSINKMKNPKKSFILILFYIVISICSHLIMINSFSLGSTTTSIIVASIFFMALAYNVFMFNKYKEKE